MRFWKWLFGIKDKKQGHGSVHFTASINTRPQKQVDDDYEPKWNTRDVPHHKEGRPQGMVQLAGASDVTVAGTSFRKEACRAFARVVDRMNFNKNELPRLILERQPDNPGHPNSIMVWGELPNGSRHHLGYVPTKISTQLAEQWTGELPIAAELRRYGRLHKGAELFFAMNILVPNAAQRRKFEKHSS